MRQYHLTAHFKDGHTAIFTFLYMGSALKFIDYLYESEINISFVTLTSTPNH